MASECLLQIVCDHNGAMDYDLLVEIASGMPEVDSLDAVIMSSDCLNVTERENAKKVIATTNIKLCKIRECQYSCKDLHLCKFYLLGECTRLRCNYSHNLKSQHNSGVLQDHYLHALTKDQLRVLLLQSDTSLLPPVCVSYNKGSDDFGNCPDKDTCTRLHICEKYVRGTCEDSKCKRSHDFHEPHPENTLRERGIPTHLIQCLPSIYWNILTIKDRASARGKTGAKNKEDAKFSNRGRMRESVLSNAGPSTVILFALSLLVITGNTICLSFVKGYCKYGDKCWRVHFDMPYKWQVEVDQVWIDLPDNEAIEKEYCDPAKIHSKEAEPVCFDTMTQGLYKVRRLSTESSVVEPTFILTTKWIWYWEDEYRNWIEYGSVKEMHRLSPVSSEELEKKYMQMKENSKAVINFRAGKHYYELNFSDMKQTNELTGAERMVRRRPFFVSASDVRAARGRRENRRGAHSSSSSHKGIPGFWDKAAVPDSGFERVSLSPSHKDYVRVQEHFNKTMKDFRILCIERIQNKQLWEDFQTKKERMKKANKDKKYAEGERLLFHGTKSRHIDAICLQNIDMRVSGTNGTVYGEGSYFARDARYSHDYTDKYAERTMFACRVLIGQYTKGQSHYRRPPPKDTAGNLYDSCVNDVREPTIFVVFERSQVYPEFLITYDKNKLPEAIQGVHFLNLHDGFTLGRSSIQPPASDVSPNANPTPLSHDSQNCPATETTFITTTNPPHKVGTSTSSSATADQALSASNTTTARSPLVFLGSTESSPKEFASTYPVAELIQAKTPNPSLVFAKSKDDISLKPAQSSAQLSFSGLPAGAAKEHLRATEISAFPKADTLVEATLSGNTITCITSTNPPHKPNQTTCITTTNPLHKVGTSTSSSTTALSAVSTAKARNPLIGVVSTESSPKDLASTHPVSDLVPAKTSNPSLVFAKSKDGSRMPAHGSAQLSFPTKAISNLPRASETSAFTKSDTTVKTTLSGNTVPSGNSKTKLATQPELPSLRQASLISSRTTGPESKFSHLETDDFDVCITMTSPASVGFSSKSSPASSYSVRGSQSSRTYNETSFSAHGRPFSLDPSSNPSRVSSQHTGSSVLSDRQNPSTSRRPQQAVLNTGATSPQSQDTPKSNCVVQ